MIDDAHTKEWLRREYRREVVHPDIKEGDRGRYTLTRGHHGKIIRATRLRDGLPVVIKSEAPSDRVRYERRLHRYLTECGAPHVLPLLDVADGPRKIYSVLPQGQPLPAKLDMPQARHIALGLLAGLEGMHALGVDHRDVKRKNMVMWNGEAHLIDFGKSAATSGMQAAIFARSDWRKAARVIGKLFRQTGMGCIERFVRWTLWWATADILDAAHMRRHVLLGGTGGFIATHALVATPWMGGMMLEGMTTYVSAYRHRPLPATGVMEHHAPLAEANITSSST